jgi:hypothetical protein
MLNPKIHGLAQFRSLNRFTAEHEWRQVEVGQVFHVTGHTYQLTAIQPKDESQGRHWAEAVIEQLGTSKHFTMALSLLWDEWDNRIGFQFAPNYVKASIIRNHRKVMARRNQGLKRVREDMKRFEVKS